MKTINYFIEKSQDVTINVKGDDVVLLSKNEVIDFILDTYGKTFTTRSKAKEITSLSYLGGVNSSAKIVKVQRWITIPTFCTLHHTRQYLE